MTSFEVVNGEPTDEELAAVVAAVAIVAGRRKAADPGNASAISRWRRAVMR